MEIGEKQSAGLMINRFTRALTIDDCATYITMYIFTTGHNIFSYVYTSYHHRPGLKRLKR